MTKRRGLWLSLGAIALMLLAGRALAGMFAERRWYAALNALDVWTLRFENLALLRTLAFLIAGGFAFVNFWGVRHSVVSLVLPRRLANIEIGEEVPQSTLLAIVIALACVFGLVFAFPASDWQAFHLARLGVAFNESDPYAGADVGFYVYWVPFERSLYVWSAGVVIVVCVAVTIMYALTPSLRWNGGRMHVSTYARRHLSVLTGVAIAMLAWSFRLDSFAPFVQGSGLGGAFSSMDYQLGVPIATILAFATISAAFVIGWAGWTGQSRVAIAVMVVLLLLTPTMQYALPLMVRWASAPVDGAVRERSFMRDRSGYTRRAFSVDRIGATAQGETFASVRDAATVSAWDPIVLTRAIERTRRGGRIVSAPSLAASPEGPVFVNIEESAPLRDDPASGGWVVVRTLASTTDEHGGVVRVDALGRFPLADQRLDPALVYEGAVGPAFVVDSAGSVAAPDMASFGARLAEAWNLQNFRLLSAQPRNTRIVRWRDVRDRVHAIAPFFVQSSRVIPVVHGDSLLWTLELYSASGDYPLSRRFMIADVEVGYFRHAATVLVSARSGSVLVVPDPELDPIATTWARALPRLFAQREQLAPSLTALLPPDVDGAEAQGRAFAAYGTRLDAVTGRKLVDLDRADTPVRDHTPTFIWLPGIGVSAWTVPVTDASDRLAGVLLATGGTTRAVRWIPNPDSTIVWNGLIDRMAQAAGAATPDPQPQVAGRVRLLPVAGGRVFALQPFYSVPASGSPALSQVVFAMGDTVRVASTVSGAVGAPQRAAPEPVTRDAREERIRALYAEMRAALEAGDWRRFGAAFDALGGLIKAKK